MKDTFTLWGHQDKESGKLIAHFFTQAGAKAWLDAGQRLVKLECRIVPRKPKLDAKDKDAAFKLWKGGAR